MLVQNKIKRQVNGSDQARMLKEISYGTVGDIKLVDGSVIKASAIPCGEMVPDIECQHLNLIPHSELTPRVRLLLGEDIILIIRVKSLNKDFVYQPREA